MSARLDQIQKSYINARRERERETKQSWDKKISKISMTTS
jgi:hypothetical protein